MKVSVEVRVKTRVIIMIVSVRLRIWFGNLGFRIGLMVKMMEWVTFGNSFKDKFRIL